MKSSTISPLFRLLRLKRFQRLRPLVKIPPGTQSSQRFYLWYSFVPLVFFVVVSQPMNYIQRLERRYELGGLVLGTVSALFGWYIWAFLTYFIGTRLLPEPQTSATYGELWRTIGFSSSPGLIRILAIIPGLTSLVFMVASVWMLVAMIIAVRQALDYRSTWRAVGVCMIGWVIQALIIILLFSLFGPSTPPQSVSP